jgi:hypothetical protein
MFRALMRVGDFGCDARPLYAVARRTRHASRLSRLAVPTAGKTSSTTAALLSMHVGRKTAPPSVPAPRGPQRGRREHSTNVKRWCEDTMALRSCAAGAPRDRLR